MFDVNNILQVGGLIAIAAVLFAEAALLLGLFLPGDTLLIAGGVYASQHKISLTALLILSAVSTIAGYEVGYLLGRRAGPHIFKQEDGILFRQDYLAKTETFFQKHGWKTILIARFIAIVRTIVPLVAGMGKMDRRRFLALNIIGGILWSAGIILLSYWVGQRVPNLDKYIQYLVLAAVVITWVGVAYELSKKKSQRQAIFRAIKTEYKYLFKK